MTNPHRMKRNKLGKKNTNNFEFVGSKSSQKSIHHAAFTIHHATHKKSNKLKFDDVES